MVTLLKRVDSDLVLGEYSDVPVSARASVVSNFLRDASNVAVLEDGAVVSAGYICIEAAALFSCLSFARKYAPVYGVGDGAFTIGVEVSLDELETWFTENAAVMNRVLDLDCFGFEVPVADTADTATTVASAATAADSLLRDFWSGGKSLLDIFSEESSVGISVAGLIRDWQLSFFVLGKPEVYVGFYADGLSQVSGEAVEHLRAKLSKLSELEKAAQEKAEEKAEEKAAEPVYSDFVEQVWRDIGSSLEKLYATALSKGYVGVLTPAGLMVGPNSASANGLYPDVWVSTFVSTVLKLSGCSHCIFVESTFPRELDKSRGLVSLPMFHLSNLSCVSNDASVRRAFYKKNVASIVQMFETVWGTLEFSQLDLIEDSILSCILLISYHGASSMELVISLPRIDSAKKALVDRLNQAGVSFCSSRTCEVVRSTVEDGIADFFCVFNMKNFTIAPLFTYQCVEELQGSKGLAPFDVVLGREISGSLRTFSFASNDAQIVGVLATSGAGKGVMTLNLLATVLASGAYFMYADKKPDMAVMLWNLERRLVAKGVTCSDGRPVRILAIDAGAGTGGTVGEPVRRNTFGYHLPIKATADDYSWVPYMKLLQLYMVLAARRKGYLEEYGGGYAFLIMDELESLLKDKVVPFVQKKGRGSSEADAYNQRLIEWVYGVINSYKAAFSKETSRLAQCRVIYLGQSAGATDWGSPVLDPFFRTTTYRFLGRPTGTPGKYFPKSTEVSTFIENSKYFGYWVGAAGVREVDEKNVEPVFKACTVLNENDAKPGAVTVEEVMSHGFYVKSMLGNLASHPSVQQELVDNVFYIRHEDGSSEVRPEIGFEGIVRKMGGFETESALADALSSGYYLMHRLCDELGLLDRYKSNPDAFVDIEEYLFDCSSASFYDTTVLASSLGATEEEGISIQGMFAMDTSSAEMSQGDKEFLASQRAEVLGPVFAKMRELEELVTKFRESKNKLTELLKKCKTSVKGNITAFETQYETLELHLNSAELNRKEYLESVAFCKQQVLDLGVSEDSADPEAQDFFRRHDSLRKYLLTCLVSVWIEFNSLEFMKDPLSDEEVAALTMERKSDILQAEVEAVAQAGDVHSDEVDEQVNTGGSDVVETSEDPVEKEFAVSEDPVDSQKVVDSAPVTSSTAKTPSGVFQVDSDEKGRHGASGGNSGHSGGVLKPDVLQPVLNTEHVVLKETDGVGRSLRGINALTDQIITDIEHQFGGARGIETIEVAESGVLIINGYEYKPSFSERTIQYLSDVLCKEVMEGKLGKVVNMGRLVDDLLDYAKELSILYPYLSDDFAFRGELHLRRRDTYRRLFAMHRNLQLIVLPDEHLTRESVATSGGRNKSGLFGRRMAEATGYDRGSGNGSFRDAVDRMMDPYDGGISSRVFHSTPVRVLTRAFGWTLGCGVVAAAAAVFGPWGLLFGALSAAGAIKETVKPSAPAPAPKSRTSTVVSSSESGSKTKTSGSGTGKSATGVKSTAKASKSDDSSSEYYDNF